MLNERIINMEKERDDLITKADRLNRRDDSIEDIMQKYQKNNNSKSRSRGRETGRGRIVDRIKQRIGNMPKGNSIEIHESRRGKEMRMQRENQILENDSLEHEGGEGEEDKEQQPEDTKQPSPNKDLEQEVDQNEDQPMFEDEENLGGGDQAFNPQTQEENTKQPIKEDAAEKQLPAKERTNTPPRQQKFDDTFERAIPSTAQSKIQEIEESKDQIDIKQLYKAQALQNKQDIDDGLDQMDYEQELLKRHEEQRVSIKRSEVAESNQNPNFQNKKPGAVQNPSKEDIIVETEGVNEQEPVGQQPPLKNIPPNKQINDKMKAQNSNREDEMDDIEDQMAYEEELLKQQNMKSKMQYDEELEDNEIEDQLAYEEELLRQQNMKPKIRHDEPQDIDQINPQPESSSKVNLKSLFNANSEKVKEKQKREKDLQLLKKMHGKQKYLHENLGNVQTEQKVDISEIDQEANYQSQAKQSKSK